VEEPEQSAPEEVKPAEENSEQTVDLGLPEPSNFGLSWKSLDGFSHIQFLKVSYIVLLLVPFAVLVQHEVTWLPEGLRRMPPIFRLLYFSSLLLSLAHMIYQGWCPPIIKRFDSPNDLYYELLKIKALQSQYLQADQGFSFHIRHCRENYQRHNYRYWFARLACSTFYVVGGILFLVVIALQALRLFGIFWGL
jgi:hypothetical protein